MVDEISSCWAMVNFRKCCGLSKDTNVSVPLYYGSLYEPQVGLSSVSSVIWSILNNGSEPDLN